MYSVGQAVGKKKKRFFTVCVFFKRMLTASLLLVMVLCAKSLQLCLTLCNPMEYNLPGSSVHGISQA